MLKKRRYPHYLNLLLPLLNAYLISYKHFCVLPTHNYKNAEVFIGHKAFERKTETIAIKHSAIQQNKNHVPTGETKYIL